MSTLDNAVPVGVALAVQARSRQAVVALLEEAGVNPEAVDIEIHDGEFGGRR